MSPSKRPTVPPECGDEPHPRDLLRLLRAAHDAEYDQQGPFYFLEWIIRETFLDSGTFRRPHSRTDLPLDGAELSTWYHTEALRRGQRIASVTTKKGKRWE